ncbi:DUF6143 family protein [Clostridium sp. JN-1]|uniref:DUF6143 family protein n=1 Tax=Clostridium sp. JN-1 TaxID=2483110 RepID=UPI000F0BB2B6|nr:DUF6143 family protein [Clostridium sp. JN-1]
MKLGEYNNYKNSIFLPNPITQAANMPYALYLSLQGKYFVGYADNMEFENENIAWAGLVNPVNSRVNLHVYVWTVTNIGEAPLIARIWFNAEPSGESIKSELVTPANTALRPLPKPRVNLLQANNVIDEPYDGDNIFTIKVTSEVTIASEEVGKFIFPPGGSFIISLSNLEASNQIGKGRVAFGWWEEKIRENK